MGSAAPAWRGSKGSSVVSPHRCLPRLLLMVRVAHLTPITGEVLSAHVTGMQPCNCSSLPLDAEVMTASVWQIIPQSFLHCLLAPFLDMFAPLPSKKHPDICREAWPIEIHMLDGAALANRPYAASRPWCILAHGRTWTWHSTPDILHKVDLPNHGKFLNAVSMDPMASYGVSRHNSSNRGSAFGLCWTAGLPLEHLKTWWHPTRNSRYNPWVSACNAAKLSEVSGGYSRMLLKKC